MLGYINSGDYDISGEFLIFGKDAFDRHMGLSEEAFGFEDPLRGLLSSAKVRRGKDSVRKRISLEASLEGFTEDERKAWEELIMKYPVVFEELNVAAFEPVINATREELPVIDVS